MFQYFSRPKIAQGTTGFDRKKTGIPSGTMPECRLKLTGNPDWGPCQNYENKEVFREEKKRQIGETLRRNFIDPGSFCPPRMVGIVGSLDTPDQWGQSLFSRDPQIWLTTIASISATGDRLPIWVIAKGRTGKCERCCHSHSEKAIKEGRLTLTHQETGWTTEEVARPYLHWLPHQMPGELLLLWDLLQRIEVWALSKRQEHSEFA
jgi:hypothetical protein